MPTVLITGANRGLGFEHCKQYAQQGWTIHAACRTPESAGQLKELAATHPDIHLHQMDVTNFEQVDAIAEALASEKIDVLINNAGLLGADLNKGLMHQTLDDISYSQWRELLEVNVLAPFKVTGAFVEQVARSDQKKILMMSSGLGSIANNTMGGLHAYRTTKASLNMLTRGLAVELAERKIIVISMAPGWCKTDMGTDNGDVEVAASIAGQQKVLAQASLDQSGQWFNYMGETVNW